MREATSARSGTTSELECRNPVDRLLRSWTDCFALFFSLLKCPGHGMGHLSDLALPDLVGCPASGINVDIFPGQSG